MEESKLYFLADKPEPNALKTVYTVYIRQTWRNVSYIGAVTKRQVDAKCWQNTVESQKTTKPEDLLKLNIGEHRRQRNCSS